MNENFANLERNDDLAGLGADNNDEGIANGEEKPLNNEALENA